MLDKNKVALLWLIREHKEGISVYELREKLQTGETKLPIALAMFQNPNYFERNVEPYVRELEALGFIKTQNGNPYHVRSKLVVTPLLHRVQDFFDISLTSTLKRTDSMITADPTLGKPKPNPAGQYARIFVAMPFKDDLKPIYTTHMLNVTKALNISCKRADDLFTTNAIVHDVWSAIYHAEFLIVDCTGRNPNVFYELGIAHTLGRPTILISQSIEDIPADIRHLRVIIYQYTPPGMAAFEAALTETIKTELGIQ